MFHRYLMLIDGEDEVYLFDRDNCAFHVKGLRFLRKSDPNSHIENTLIDGVIDFFAFNLSIKNFLILIWCIFKEMVIDKVEGKNIPRFLCYDIIKIEGQNVGVSEFYPTRLRCIESEIVNPRYAFRFLYCS